MYVIVVGGGKVGYYLTKTLLSEGREVLLIEKDRRHAELLAEELGEVAMAGDGCEVRVMSEAGMGRAEAVVAVTGDDEDNLVICQMAKRHFDVKRTIARVNDPRNEEIFRLLGIDATLASTKIIYSLIEQEVDTGQVVPLTALKRGNIEIVEADLTAQSPVVNRALKDIHLPGDSVVAVVIRGDQIVLPSGTTRLEEGDCVIALTRPADERALRELMAGSAGDGAESGTR
ncbi:MAG: NAD-binding protein [Armatimonadota bacterium]|nr:MAG: NAD-binding protein [Armatimonadota bacterium]